MDKEAEIEEERRLCYVGFTRAKEFLYLTYAKQRTIFGSTSCNKVSRFIEEIPKELLDGYEETRIGKYKDEGKAYNWEYGNVKKYQKEPFKSKFLEPALTFHFRTPETFLNSLNESPNIVDLSKFKVGIMIYHKKFGKGVINSVEETEGDLKLDITFKKAGHKRLMAKYANLEII